MKQILLLLFLSFSFTANALAPEERLKKNQEERAILLFNDIKCLVCEAQSIESSDTEFSRSLRKLIRNKIKLGLSNQEIKSQLRQEFGEQIFMSTTPESSILVWILPFIFAVILALIFFIRTKKISNNIS